MSIDPAINYSQTIEAALPFDRLEVSSDAVYVFDFDGVVSSSFEDDIYKLPPTGGERRLIAAAAQKFGIRCEGMEQRYQRHLLYQAAAWCLKLPIAPGPGLAKAKQANDFSRLFVLTARSGWHATERLRDFLRQHGIIPIETYHVGRVKKDRQIELLCREYPDKTVHFIEDSAAHLTSIAALNFANLRLVLVARDFDRQPKVAYLRERFRKVMKTAMYNWEANVERNT